MSDSHIEFERRVRAIDEKHRAFAHGVEATLQNDGLIVLKPKGTRPYLPARGAALLIAGFLMLKGVLLASLGPVTYAERVADLAAGSAFEKAGSAIMVPDPVSELVGRNLRVLIR